MFIAWEESYLEFVFHTSMSSLIISVFSLIHLVTGYLLLVYSCCRGQREEWGRLLSEGKKGILIAENNWLEENLYSLLSHEINWLNFTCSSHCTDHTSECFWHNISANHQLECDEKYVLWSMLMSFMHSNLVVTECQSMHYDNVSFAFTVGVSSRRYREVVFRFLSMGKCDSLLLEEVTWNLLW